MRCPRSSITVGSGRSLVFGDTMMRFYLPKRRQTPTIIVVALIDVLIVLLIFLMVTTTFRQQSALKVALPESSQTRTEGSNENVPLFVSIERNDDLRLGPDARPVTLDGLRRELMDAVVKKPDLKGDLYSDSNSTVGQLVKVMDVVKGANISSLNLRTREPGKPKGERLSR
jgi:biopolymer transport protein ExbD